MISEDFLSSDPHISKLVEIKNKAFVAPERVEKFIRGTDPNEPWHTIYTQLVNEFFEAHTRPGAVVLDVGCGPGQTTLHLKALQRQVVAMDYSFNMLAALKQSDGGRTIPGICADAHRMPLKDRSVDGVVARMFIMHFPTWKVLISEMARCCKAGARIVLHMQSADHRDFARSLGGKEYVHYYSDDPSAGASRYSGSVSRQDLELACEEFGIQLLEISPLGFFVSNMIIGHALGTEAHTEYKERFQTLLENPEIREFVLWFEKTVVRHLHPTMAYNHIVVMEKN